MNHRVLFVEDEALLRTVYQRQTQNLFEVDLVASAEEALVAIAKRDYAVVISDMSMPGMDGLTLAYAIRQQDPRVVLMILSAHSSWIGPASPPDFLFRVLAKPCPRNVLLASLEEAIVHYNRSEEDSTCQSSAMQ